MRDNKETIIAYYKGAYGQTIRIDVQNEEWINMFRNLLINLRDSEVQTIDLLGIKNTKGEDVTKLEIVKSNNYGLSLMKKIKNRTDFIWHLDNEKVEFILDMIDNFIRNNIKGHHYLYEDKPAIIEFAYKE